MENAAACFGIKGLLWGAGCLAFLFEANFEFVQCRNQSKTLTQVYICTCRPETRIFVHLEVEPEPESKLESPAGFPSVRSFVRSFGFSFAH